MDVFVNKIHYPVNNLGPGSRLGIWFQGCAIRCKGCINPDTWDYSLERKVDIEILKEVLKNFKNEKLDGITITGGEPFDQPEALGEMLMFLRRLTGGDILVYSGYGYRRLKEKYGQILENVDVLISEPFVIERTDRLIWRGSDNQKVHLISDLAKEKYPKNINSTNWLERRMQYSVVGTDLYMIGIPARSGLENFYNLLKKRGIHCENV